MRGRWPFYPADWGTLPPGSQVTQLQKQAALANVCLLASTEIDGFLNFPIRAVLNTEQEQGPNYRVTVRNSTREGRMILSRWPVTNISSVQVAPAGVYPIQWTPVPAGSYRPEYPVIGHPSPNVPSGSGEGGQAILIAPGYVNWCRGRWGVVVQATYTHGWPHTSLTAAAAAGSSTLSVSDCTAWGPFAAGSPGAAGTIYDTLAGQEPISVAAASAETGPGTLTLDSPLAYPHAASVMVSSLPTDVIWAAALFAAAAALTRGAQATVNAAAPGRGGGGTAVRELKEHGWNLLDTFRRTI